MASKVAAQMYTVRAHTKTASGLADSLKKLSKMGYRAVQLSAVGAMQGEAPDVSPRAARTMLDDNGLKCIATHRSWDDLAGKTDVEIKFHQTVGCDFTAIGGFPAPREQWNEDTFRTFLDEARPVIAKLKEAGIRFGYHNHAYEFMRYAPGPKTLYDIFIDDGGPDLMMEVDTYWVNHGGADPVQVLKRCAGRIPVIHVKDKEMVLEDGPTVCPIGEGNLNWDDIIVAAEAGGTEWYAVEQDTCRRDAFDCLKSSLEFLTSKGI